MQLRDKKKFLRSAAKLFFRSPTGRFSRNVPRTAADFICRETTSVCNGCVPGYIYSGS